MTQPGADRPQTRGLTIGKLAQLCGVHIETIRYYQRRGLLPEPQRPPGGYRQYPEALAHRLHFIRGAQDLGFTLREIEELLELGSHACEETRHRATRKIADIDARIAGLQTMRRTLTDLVQSCHEGPSDVCAIHSRLADSESTAAAADRYPEFNKNRRPD